MSATLRAAMTYLLLSAALYAVTGPARADLTVNGIEGELRDNALAHLALDGESCDAANWRIQRQFDDAPAQLRSALEAFGYYGAKITSSLTFNEDCWSARIDIDPGDPVRIRSFDVAFEGAARDDPVYQAAFAQPPFAQGDPLHQGVYEQFKTRLLEIATRRGYPDAKFTVSRVDVYPAELAADVTLHFDSGPRYAFGPITLSQDVLVDSLVRAYLGFDEGDPYDAAKLDAAYLALTDSAFFESVSIRPQAPDREALQIPVTVELTAAPRKLISYGVGFSTDTGPRLRFGRNNRRWNDRGHQFELNAQLSPVVSELSASYRYPYGDPRTEWMSVDGGIKREETDTSLSKTLEFGARRIAELRRGWTRTQQLSLRLEDFEVGEQTGRSKLLMPGINWSRLSGDGTVRPRKGAKLDIQVRGASDSLGSDTSFAQLYVQGKWIRSVLQRSRVLIRGEVGATREKAFTDLPASVRFFAGGDNSVRGYAFESLGPVDANGEVVGGSSLLTASVEYEHPLTKRWSMAFFVDAGNAFEGTDFEPMTGAGLGIRWQSPLGPIRLDIGVPVHAGDRGPRLHISLGPDL
jgi:translocation and assembly module TamA